jgi:hypothetical protein
MIVSSLFELGVYHLFRSADRFEGVVIVWATSDVRAEFPSRPITIHCRCGWGDKKTIGLAGTEGQTGDNIAISTEITNSDGWRA